VIDPSFGEIRFSFDAWDGLVPFAHAPSKLSAFGVHVWADDSGPTDSQRATFEELKARYASLWPAIADAVLECHPDLHSVADVARHVNPTVGCYIEYGGVASHDDFELVYDFDFDDGRGVFVRFAGWSIVDAFLAE
jgi:hypothetical protein